MVLNHAARAPGDDRVPVGQRHDTPSGTARAVATAGVGLVLAALPVFLVGGLAVQVRADLGLGEADLGAAVAAAFLVGAVASPLTGRLADRLGATRSILLGAAWSVAAATGVATVADSGATLAGSLALSGLGFGFMDPGLALLVQSRVPSRRQGLALGVKEAAVPAAGLLAGLAVPTIALTIGWRWAFALIVPVLVLLVGLVAPWQRPDERPRRPAPAVARNTHRPAGDSGPSVPGSMQAAWVLALAAALGSAAASGVGIFLTDTAVARGLSPSAAGLLLSLGSVAGIVARLGAGIRADRRTGSPVATMSAMLAVGSVAMAVGSLPGTLPLVVGTLGTFGAGWAWSGLLFLGLLRLRPGAAGSATGIGLAGLAIGNALGPLGFGVLAESSSPRVAWLVAAGLAGLAAALLRWHLRRGPGPTSAPPARTAR